MAKTPTTSTDTETVSTSDAPEIKPEAYYRVEVRTRFRAFGAGFGPQSRTEVTGALLQQLLASEHAGKVAGWTAV